MVDADIVECLAWEYLYDSREQRRKYMAKRERDPHFNVTFLFENQHSSVTRLSASYGIRSLKLKPREFVSRRLWKRVDEDTFILVTIPLEHSLLLSCNSAAAGAAGESKEDEGSAASLRSLFPRSKAFTRGNAYSITKFERVTKESICDKISKSATLPTTAFYDIEEDSSPTKAAMMESSQFGAWSNDINQVLRSLSHSFFLISLFPSFLLFNSLKLIKLIASITH
jgi:hypothetical protein